MRWPVPPEAYEKHNDVALAIFAIFLVITSIMFLLFSNI